MFGMQRCYNILEYMPRLATIGTLGEKQTDTDNV